VSPYEHYCRLAVELSQARADGLDQEEARLEAELNDCWKQLSTEEQHRIEVQLEHSPYS